MQLIATIRNGEEIQLITTDSADYAATRDAAAAQIPDGWQLLSYRVSREESFGE